MGTSIKIWDRLKRKSSSSCIPIWRMHCTPIVECLRNIFKKSLFVLPVKIEGLEEWKPSNFAYMLYYFIYFSFFSLLFWTALETIGLITHTLIHGSLPYQEEFSLQSGEIILHISHRTLWLNIHFSQMLLLTIASISSTVLCVNQYPDWSIWTNYEVVDFQTQSGISTFLDSVDFIQLYSSLLPPQLFQPCYGSLSPTPWT